MKLNQTVSNVSKTTATPCDFSRAGLLHLSSHTSFLRVGTSTKRICDGYEAGIDKPTAPQIRWAGVLDFRPKTPRFETRSMHFFLNKTLVHLQTFLPDQFWNTQVLQLAQSDKCIWAALVAFSSYHEQFLLHGLDCDQSLALHQHNKAIKYLLDSKASQTPLTYIVSCILFICIEILRGHFKTAASLFLSGCKLLGSLRRQQTWTKGGASDIDVILRHLQAIFTTLAVQNLIMFPGIRPALREVVSPLLDSVSSFSFSFDSLAGARESLHHLALDLLIDVDKSIHRDMFLLRYRNWCQAFDLLYSEHCDTPTIASDQRALALVELLKRYLALSQPICDPETTSEVERSSITNNHFIICNEMIHYAEKVCLVAAEPNYCSKGRFHFYMDTGVGAPLFYVISVCHDPYIRRKALALIKSRATVQEGMWNCNLVVKAATGIMALEEAGLAITANTKIPTEARVKDISVFVDEQQRHVVIEYQLSHGRWQKLIDPYAISRISTQEEGLVRI